MPENQLELVKYWNSMHHRLGFFKILANRKQILSRNSDEFRPKIVELGQDFSKARKKTLTIGCEKVIMRERIYVEHARTLTASAAHQRRRRQV